MAELTIGRVGFDFDFDNPNQIRSRVDGRRHQVEISGELRSSSLANTKALRSELEQHAVAQHSVAVTMSDDSFIDGFYQVTSVNIEAEDYALNSTGLFDFRITLERLGTAQKVEATSLIGGLLVTNDYGIAAGEEEYAWAPPVGAEAVSGAGSPTGLTRVTEDGNIEVFVGVDPDLDPTWICDPADFYKGAVEIVTGGYVRAGTDTPEDLLTWKLRNGIIEVFADGTNNGVINLQTSADETPYGFKIMFESSTAIPAWNYPSIVRNDPEMCILRLSRDANESPPTDSMHDIYITMRRGFPFVWCEFNWSGAATTWSVDRESTDGAASVTPTGGTAGMAIRDAADDGDGNRWFLGGFDHDAVDTTNGGLDWTSNVNKFVFVLGMEIGGSSAATLDAVTALMPQACGWLGETVRMSRR